MSISCQNGGKKFWHEIDILSISCLIRLEKFRHEIDMIEFYGRVTELAEFRKLLAKKTSSLVTCQGRRRIGKSRFIRECGKDADLMLEFSGLPPRVGLTRQQQIDAFCEQLTMQTKLPRVQIQSWESAFQLLYSQLPSKGSVVILLDEISWMAIGDPDFAGQLKVAWDLWFSKRNKTVVVLCGSVSSWIEQNILNSTGFVGRTSWNFRIGPLQLKDCLGFWGSHNRRTSTAEKVRLLSITGGVPKYLEEIDPKQSAEENIRQLCFNSSGLLFQDFESIFHDVFGRKASSHRDIVRSLVDGPKSIGSISESIGRERGGSLSDSMRELEMSGFVIRDVPFDLSTGESRPRLTRYRLYDNYLRFYLKYIEPNRSRIESGRYKFMSLDALPHWDAILGRQLENLVLQNLDKVYKAVGLTGDAVINAAPYLQTKTRRQKGCQIDLLIQTKRTLYVIEIKFRQQIEKRVVAEIHKKVDSLANTKNYSIRTGLIFQGELAQSILDENLIDFAIPVADLF
jgi:uncharacterized protein